MWWPRAGFTSRSNIGSLLQPNNYNRQSVQEVKSDHNLITDSEDFANKFVNFFEPCYLQQSP